MSDPDQSLTADEIRLFETARDVLEQVHHPERHQVAAAVLTAGGSIYVGMHLGSRRINICAESSAIANAHLAQDPQLTAMVAVCKDGSGRVVVTNPCGVCRELAQTYAPEARILVDVAGVVRAASVADLMPNPWRFPHENPWDVQEPGEQEK